VRPLFCALRLLPRTAARDGAAGAILAVLEAYRVAATVAKLWELEHAAAVRGG
jgi:hypothetical protein